MSAYIPNIHHPRNVAVVRATAPASHPSDDLQVPEVSVVIRVMAPDGVSPCDIEAALDRAADAVRWDSDVALKLAGAA